MNNKKVFNVNQIEAACVIGSPLLAGILIALNYKSFEERQKGIAWIIIGILWTAVIIGLAMLIPENLAKSSRMFIPILNGAILYPIINKLQGDQIKAHFDNNGEKGSNWVLAGLMVFIVALFVTPFIILDKMSPVSQYSRQSFDLNGIYYNSEMNVDEVDKLGRILQRIDYFNNESSIEVIFLDNDSTYEFKLIIEKSYFNDTITINDIKPIFKHLDFYEFEKPLTFKIIDPLLESNKVVELENYDNILLLQEYIHFEKNPNFILMYDLEIDKAEIDKFQEFILKINDVFNPQNRFDFMFTLEDGNYFLRLFIPKQNWSNKILIAELKQLKVKLNVFRFKYPFRLILVDGSSLDIEELEIK